MSVKNVAIDGYAGCGKSSTAKAIAKKLNMVYIDTGAMYRAITLFFIKKNIDICNPKEIISTLKSLKFSYSVDQSNEFTLKVNDIIFDNQLRTKAVNEYVSTVSALKEVRQFLLEKQKDLASKGNVVIEGRDIGTHVIPNADVKIFVTASIDKRVERRYKELQEKGIKMTKSEIEANFLERDTLDSNRQHNPLKIAEDAHILDTSCLAFNAQVEKVVQLISKCQKWK